MKPISDLIEFKRMLRSHEQKLTFQAMHMIHLHLMTHNTRYPRCFMRKVTIPQNVIRHGDHNLTEVLAQDKTLTSSRHVACSSSAFCLLRACSTFHPEVVDPVPKPVPLAQ